MSLGTLRGIFAQYVCVCVCALLSVEIYAYMSFSLELVCCSNNSECLLFSTYEKGCGERNLLRSGNGDPVGCCGQHLALSL